MTDAERALLMLIGEIRTLLGEYTGAELIEELDELLGHYESECKGWVEASEKKVKEGNGWVASCYESTVTLLAEEYSLQVARTAQIS